jgi:glycosyltransferase involved in cell wall biosynthesis
MADTIIVIPCYNEADRLDVDAFVHHALADPPYRFLFVNDGSQDGTLDVLRSLEEYDPQRFALLDLAENGGKAEAVRQGVLAAFNQSPKYVGYWDADLATPLEAIEPFRHLLESRPDLQVALGARVRMLGRRIARKPLRHLLGRVFATGASWVLQMGIYDTQCGAKLFRVTEETRALFAEPFITNWIFDVEWLARLIRRQRSGSGADAAALIYELPLDTWRDVHGSKVRPRDFFKAFRELLAIRSTYLRGLPELQRAIEVQTTDSQPARTRQGSLPSEDRPAQKSPAVTHFS